MPPAPRNQAELGDFLEPSFGGTSALACDRILTLRLRHMPTAMPMALKLVALKIVVLLSRGPASDPALETLESSARQLLGPDAELDIVTTPEATGERREQMSLRDADGVVDIRWTADRLRATLYTYSRNGGTRSERQVDFRASDDERDKGRHLGLLIGSLLDAEQAAGPPREAVRSTPETSNPSTEPKQRDSASAGRVVPSVTARDAKSVSDHALGWTLEALLSAALGGAGGGLGANIAFRTAITGGLWWQLSAGARAGEVPQAQATTQMVRAGSGLEWWAPAGSSFELGVRGEAIANWLQVGHLSPDDPEVDRKRRWNAGGALSLLAAVAIDDTSAIVVSSGLEAWAGQTELYTHGRRVATLTRVNLLTSVGFRISY